MRVLRGAPALCEHGAPAHRLGINAVQHCREPLHFLRSESEREEGTTQTREAVRTRLRLRLRLQLHVAGVLRLEGRVSGAARNRACAVAHLHQTHFVGGVRLLLSGAERGPQE